MRQWFYAHDDQQQGPIQETKLVTILAQVSFSPTPLCGQRNLANGFPHATLRTSSQQQ